MPVPFERYPKGIKVRKPKEQKGSSLPVGSHKPLSGAQHKRYHNIVKTLKTTRPDLSPTARAIHAYDLLMGVKNGKYSKIHKKENH